MRKSYFFLLLTALCLLSCEKSVESRIIGDWDYLGDEYFIQTSVFVKDSTVNKIRATVTFNKGGKGEFSNKGVKSKMTWTATDSEVTLGIEGKDTLTYKVIANEAKVQTWMFKKEKCGNENSQSYCFNWDNYLTLKKYD